MTEGAHFILDLLTYIERVEKLKSKPAFTVPAEFFVAYQHEFEELPEIRFNQSSNTDDVWMRVPRLRENPAPVPGEALAPWITLPGNPVQPPVLRAESTPVDTNAPISGEPLDKHRIEQVTALLAAYIRDQWEPWAVAERPRRQAMARYDQLFSLHQAIASQGPETALELAWGMGLAVWKKGGYPAALQYPLIVQSCEVTLNEQTFDLEVRPRDVAPRLETDIYAELGAPGLAQLDAVWKSLQASGADRVNPFDESSFEGICQAALTHLDPSGTCALRKDGPVPPAASGALQITNTWVLFAKKRSGAAFMEDVQRLKLEVEDAPVLPAAIRNLVEVGDTKLGPKSEASAGKPAAAETLPRALEPYFPRPYNDEQLSVVKKLEANSGVVVKGPPGTGKTHTIANVICHYLARGQRVLVTAESETALAALREQLPERIRPLSVAVLSNEREGMRQLEQSIRDVATTASGMNPATAAARIANLEQRIHKLHAKIAEVDHTVAAFAAKHLSSFNYRGRDVTPADMAETVMRQAKDHQWFDDDIPMARGAPLPFDESHISALRQARIKVGDDLPYLDCSLPGVEEQPEWSELLSLHRALVRTRIVKPSIERTIGLLDSQPGTFRKAQALLQFLEDRASLKRKIEAQYEPWFATFYNRLANLAQPDPALLDLLNTCASVERLESNRRLLQAQAVVIPTGVELNQEFSQTVDRLAAGENAFAKSFGKTHLRKLLEAVSVGGSAPRTKESWQFVALSLRWCIDARSTLSRWNELAREFGMNPAGYRLESDFMAMVVARGHIEDLRRLALDFDAKLPIRFEEVFARGPSGRIWKGGEASISMAMKTLKENLDEGSPGYAMHRISELLQQLEKHSGAIVSELRDYLSLSLGRANADESVLQARWVVLKTELTRLTGLQASFRQIALVSNAIQLSGAAKWAKRIQTQPAAADHDPIVPARWLKAWNWRRACLFLDQIDVHETLRKHFEARRAMTSSLASVYQDLVAERSWLGVLNNSPYSVRHTLLAQLDSAHPASAGADAHLVRHPMLTRDAMDLASRVLPCWILPRWRVSEILPPDLGLFDLVVIDEASQADLRALPASLRGKNILVVGDHKQVSPSAAEVNESKLAELTTQFLTNQPLGLKMTLGKSIFDLARVAFGSNAVELKEHFRCAPAIIEFSNEEFYSGHINPLRLPRANARLDPPLVDVFVQGGSRKRDINSAEAKAIVHEIESLLADPRFDGRSIGVVTLVGSKQATYIQELINERISPADIVARKITAGQAAAFQGRERDIMMVSMVLAPGDEPLADRPEIRQRLNVALSRARDRMYLFRSVPDGAFDEASLNARVMRHFKKPFAHDVAPVEALRERCESAFERAMFDELVKRNYRVEPQVRCGAYRMDLVVEGVSGRSLAIECDGDRFDVCGQWAKDMARQQVLERAGWTFWRCFSSSFTRRRDAVLADLLRTLRELGIEPVPCVGTPGALSVVGNEEPPPRVGQALDGADFGLRTSRNTFLELAA
jgi:very-short-patch-repair endonuclease